MTGTQPAFTGPGVEPERAVGAWLWLFPATYALHVAEEAWAGETFPRWISRVASVDFTNAEFWLLNGAALAAMSCAILVFTPRRRSSELAVVFGTIVLVNTTAHAVGSVVTRSYSPGVITALVLWSPLGIAALIRARAALERRTYALGIALGIIVHAVVSARALAELWWPD